MSDAGSRPTRNPWAVLAALVVGLSAVVIAMLAAFALPNIHGGPHAMPLGVTGPQAVVQAVQERLDGDSWEVTAYPDREALADAIRERSVAGGISVGADGVGVLTAGAGGATAASAITAVGTTLAQQQHLQVTVEDLVPFPERDPRGSGLTSAALPLVFGGIIPAVALTRLFPGRANLRIRLIGVLGFSVVAGAAITAFLQYGTGSLTGNYWLTAAGLALGVAALACTMLGLEALFGFVGLGIGAVVMMFLGNPLSGIGTGDHWLPDGWSTLGQLLPPGASGSLLRANAFFDGAGALRPVLVLTAWTVFGLALSAIAARRGDKASTAPADALTDHH
ncbi:ABC transporter permease [Rhodococcus sp. NPDC003348]